MAKDTKKTSTTEAKVVEKNVETKSTNIPKVEEVPTETVKEAPKEEEKVETVPVTPRKTSRHMGFGYLNSWNGVSY